MPLPKNLSGQSLQLRAQPAKQSSDWFEKQLDVLRERVVEAQNVLSSYQQEHGIVAVDERLDIENARLNDLSRQLVESQSRTNELQSRKNQLNASKQSDHSRES